MKKTFITFFLLLSVVSCFGQSFEGEIVYANTYKSKSPNLTDQQMSSMLGSVQNYYIKGGDYKSVTNGNFISWQLYVNTDNKLYNKFSNSEIIFWNDGSVDNDKVLNSEIHKGVTEILGYKCDELVLTCKSGVQKYYFTSRLPVDSKLYINHLFGNWFAYLSKANALPLKMIIDTEQFTLESTATQVKPMKLGQVFFTLPAGVKTAKSPY